MAALTFDDRLRSAEESGRFATLYEAAFPASERDDTPALLASLAAGRRLIVVARADGALVGFAVYALLRSVSLAFVEYLAVDERSRGQGVGAALLKEFRRRLREGPGAVAGALLEIDSVEQATGDELARRIKRLRFFTSAGGTVVGGLPRIEVPNLSKGGSLELTLMWLPTSGTEPAPEGPVLRRAITAILTEGYDLPPSHRLVLKNVNAAAP